MQPWIYTITTKFLLASVWWPWDCTEGLRYHLATWEIKGEKSDLDVSLFSGCAVLKLSDFTSVLTEIVLATGCSIQTFVSCKYLLHKYNSFFLPHSSSFLNIFKSLSF